MSGGPIGLRFREEPGTRRHIGGHTFVQVVVWATRGPGLTLRHEVGGLGFYAEDWDGLVELLTLTDAEAKALADLIENPAGRREDGYGRSSTEVLYREVVDRALRLLSRVEVLDAIERR